MGIVSRACVLLFLTLPPFAAAADAEASPGTDTSTAPRKSDVDIRSIVAAVSQKTHKKFVIDPRVAASVNWIGMDPRDVTYPVLLSILAVHGFATYEQDGVVFVVPDVGMRMVGIPPIAPGDIRGPDAEILTTVVPVRNANAAQLVPILRPLMPQTALLAAITGTNALLMTDRAANVRRIIEIVETIDKLPVQKPPSDKGE